MAAKEKELAAAKAQAIENSGRRGLVLALILSLIGLAIAIELFRVHLTVDKGEVFNSVACRINEKVDCNAVARSQQAMFLSLPVPLWAIITYLALGTLAALGLLAQKEPLKHAGDYILLASVWCALYSAYLAYVSLFILKTLCALCAGLYAVNLGLFVAGILASYPLSGFMKRRGQDGAWLLRNPARLGLTGFFLVLLIAGMSVLYARSERVGAEPVSGIDVAGDPVIGFERAPVTIIEFSDFECPACRHMHENVKVLLEKYKYQVRLIHKNYPLDSSCNPSVPAPMHPNACNAAAASVCAQSMGKYQSYSEKLWTATDLTPQSLIAMAAGEGMDKTAFQQCMKSDETRLKVLNDISVGDAIKLEATPTFVINGLKFTGYKEVKWCSTLIDKLLKGEPIPPSGVPLQDE